MGTTGGRRERKKLATRQALSDAALRLAREQGPQNVRVDDIAEAAGVSPRTYNNYFSSREQAIMVALAAERGQHVAAALRKRPVDEPLEHAVAGALIEQYSDDGEPDRDTLALITSAPALQAEFLDTIAAIERPLAEAIATRTGTDRPGELGPEVLAAAVSGAARIAAQRWLQPEPDTTFSAMLNDALTWIAPALRAADRSPQPEDTAAIRTSDSTRQDMFSSNTANGGGLLRGTATTAVEVSDRQSACRADSGPRTPSSRSVRPPAAGSASTRTR